MLRVQHRYHQRFLKKQRRGSHAVNAFIFYHSCFKSVGKKAEYFTRKETTFESRKPGRMYVIRNIDEKRRKRKKKKEREKEKKIACQFSTKKSSFRR